MNENKRNIDTDALFWGILLVAIGTVFLLDNLDIGDFHLVFRDYWPLFIVAAGVSKLFHRGKVWSGIWLIAVGAWLQATTLHLYGMSFSSSWPLLLIALGGGMVLRTLFEGLRGHRTDESTEARHDG